MPKAYSYLRFSTLEQQQGDSFRRQTQLAVDYCAQHKLTLDTSVTYNDLGVSAFRGKNADTGRLAEFLEAVKEGIVEPGSYLLVESLDRVSRQAARKALRVLEDICEAGITVVTLVDGKQYTEQNLTDDPMSLIMSLLIFIRANEESVMKSRRLKAAWVGKRLNLSTSGKVLTGRGPAWLQLVDGKWEVIEERAAIVRRIFKMAKNGQGPVSITHALNKEQVPTFGGGKQWHYSYVEMILKDRPQVIGTCVPFTTEYVSGRRVRKQCGEPIPNYFPAVIDNETYRTVQMMQKARSYTPKGGKRWNIFTGLVTCARCGGSMNIQRKGPVAYHKGYFICTKARYGKGCKYTAVRYDRVEEGFLKEAKVILGSTPSYNPGTNDGLERAQANLEALEDKRDNLLASQEVKHSDIVAERLASLDAELQAAKDLYRKLQEDSLATSGVMVEKRVSDLLSCLSTMADRGEVNAMMRALFSGLSINPDNGQGTLKWKHGGQTMFTWGFPSVEQESAA